VFNFSANIENTQRIIAPEYALEQDTRFSLKAMEQLNNTSTKSSQISTQNTLTVQMFNSKNGLVGKLPSSPL